MGKIERNLKQPENPSHYPVLRDSKGRILWNLQENTIKQNELLGISNVQGIFLEKFPEFSNLFPLNENGKVKDSFEAAKFITEKIGRSKTFIGLMGATIVNRRYVPYFDGSHLVVLEKAFKPWGIELRYVTNDQAVEKGERIRRTLLMHIVQTFSLDDIETEAARILEQEGKLTQEVLYRTKRGRLAHAITKNYPGGFKALKLKLSGRNTQSTQYNPQANPLEPESFLFDFKAEMEGIIEKSKKLYPEAYEKHLKSLSKPKRNQLEIVNSEDANEQLRRLFEAGEK